MMIKRIVHSGGLLLLGAAGLLAVQWLIGSREHDVMPAPVVTAPPAPVGGAQVLTLSPEAVTRAGIKVESLGTASGTSTVLLPGTVEPQGYRVVDVTPIVGGTVVSVEAELGAAVRQGAVVARLRSPELTDLVRQWLTLRAERDVVAKRLARTQALAKIGAASSQDVEQDQASDVRVSTELETARARLARVGLTETRLAALSSGDALPETVDVVANASGVVIRRTVNPGQNVDPTQPLMTLADPSLVWIMADVFEADLSRIRVGQAARVTSAAFPGREWKGRVLYVEPEVSRETRTVRVRVEVSNPDAALRFGMFVSVAPDLPQGADQLTVPASALQSLGTVTVAYVEVGEGRFEERVVPAGLRSGDRVVVAGSFALRSERERLGWPAPIPAMSQSVSSIPSRETTARILTRVVEITAAGLVPDRVTVPANQPIDLVFIRRVEDTCGEEVAIPDLGIRRTLPINQRVTIRLPPRPPGELSFSCGLNMLRGVIVIGGLTH